MSYPVNRIADYIIEYAAEKDNPVNNLKLQKILYFLEARFLVEGRGSLFDEKIEKWKYGPVMPDVYYRFNYLGAESITHVPNEFDFMSLLNKNSADIHFEFKKPSTKETFSNTDKLIIDETLDKFINLDPFFLVRETHKHNAWAKDEEKIMAGIRHIQYDRNDILEDFKRYPEFKLWVN